MDTPRKRLKLAREGRGKLPEAMAAASGISVPSYYDLEWVDGEIESSISLGALQKVCAEVGIRSADLFRNQPVKPVEEISLFELAAKVKKHLADNSLTTVEFEDRVGFEIRECLENVHSILDWDIECLRSVCAELGVDWIAALP